MASASASASASGWVLGAGCWVLGATPPGSMRPVRPGLPVPCALQVLALPVPCALQVLALPVRSLVAFARC
jgi:hypothetical protein